jgi:hypothetical protein
MGQPGLVIELHDIARPADPGPTRPAATTDGEDDDPPPSSAARPPSVARAR